MSNPFDDRSLNFRSYSLNTTIEDEVDNYEREVGRILQASLDSTQRSAQRLENSEQLATDTAQELLTQREKIERTEKHLDEIHCTTHETQRNLNRLKSFLGGFLRNKLFSRKKSSSQETDSKETAPTATESKLGNRLASMESNHQSAFNEPSFGPSLSADSRAAIKGTRFEDVDNQIDDNLDLISAKLRNLREIGKALGEEVDDQNQMLDRIHKKADRNDAAIRNQDVQMKKLLGYKNVETPDDTVATSK